MRQINLTKSRSESGFTDADLYAEQAASHESLWALLGTTGLSSEGIKLQSLLRENCRLVIAVTRQYQGRGLSAEDLLAVAHRAFITLLNQHAHRPELVQQVLTVALRNALSTAIDELNYSKKGDKQQGQ